MARAARPRALASRPLARDAASAISAPIVAARHVEDQELHAPARTPVTHSHAALAFYTSGRSRMALNGDWDIREGDIVIVPAGAAHHLIERRRSTYWGVSFCAPCYASEDAAAALLAPLERVRDGGAAVVSLPADRHGYLEALFGELARTGNAARHDALPLVQRSLLTLVLAEVDRAAAMAPPRVTPGGGVVAQALRFIERNCLRPLTVEEVAAAVDRTPTYVTSALKQATGRSAVQWIVSGRMAEARRSLLHSDARVDAIAERVGYADPTHFIRLFRREHGATPAAWRAAVRARDPSPDPR